LESISLRDKLRQVHWSNLFAHSKTLVVNLGICVGLIWSLNRW